MNNIYIVVVSHFIVQSTTDIEPTNYINTHSDEEMLQAEIYSIPDLLSKDKILHKVLQ